MKTTKLTEEEFKATMTARMVDVTTKGDASVDIWPYVELLVRNQEVPHHVCAEKVVQMVSRNDQGTFDHVLLSTEKPNVFVVVIIDLRLKQIKGHFSLDLNQEYGLE